MYKCYKCGKELKSKNGLVNHEKFCDGTGTKLDKKKNRTLYIWVCPLCGYNIKTSRKKHLNYCGGKGPRRTRPKDYTRGSAKLRGKSYEEIYGEERAKEIKDKISRTNSKNPGRQHTEETKNKISKMRVEKGLSSGPNNPMFGKHHTQESRDKISVAQSGKKAPNWKGGISFEPYPSVFNNKLKNKIGKRDNFICQICGKGNSNHIHHIDYNKENCEERNLITTCIKCHGKTNYNRGIWFQHLTEIQTRRYKWNLE